MPQPPKRSLRELRILRILKVTALFLETFWGLVPYPSRPYRIVAGVFLAFSLGIKPPAEGSLRGSKDAKLSNIIVERLSSLFCAFGTRTICAYDSQVSSGRTARNAVREVHELRVSSLGWEVGEAKDILMKGVSRNPRGNPVFTSAYSQN